MNSDGTVVVVGGPGNSFGGHVRVFQRDANSTVFYQKGSDVDGIEQNGFFGSSVAMDGSGNRFIAGAAFAGIVSGIPFGRVRLYDFESTSKNGVLNDKADFVGQENELLGQAVAITENGKVIAFSSQRESSVYVLSEQDDGSWEQLGETPAFSGNIGNFSEATESFGNCKYCIFDDLRPH
jgi:hypothetical protein